MPRSRASCIGGALVQANPAGLGWRSCFLINIPIGILAVIAAPRIIKGPGSIHGARAGSLDLAGTVLATVGLTAIVLPLVEGRAHGWPLWTWLSLAAAPVLLGAFVLQQRRLAARGGTPLMPPALFASRGVHRRAGRPDAVLVRAGVVLPRALAVPAARTRA